MSKDLACWLTAIAVDLVAMVGIYSVTSYFLIRYTWHKRGTGPIFLLVLISQLLWIPVAMLTATPSEFEGNASYSAWFGNWLVTGFALLLLRRTIQTIPKSHEDAARLDGLGALATWRHVLLPFISRDLALLATLLLMALLFASWHFLLSPIIGSPSFILLHRIVTPGQYLLLMGAASLLGAIPLIAIFFFAQKTRPRR